MRKIDREKYLANRQTRVHFAIKAKRVLGRWVPNSGPIEDSDRILKRMHHELINYRAGDDCKPTRLQNMLSTVRSSNDPHRAIERYAQPGQDRRTTMSARRIAHRLGLIEERADFTEKQNRWTARYGSDAEHHVWVTVKPFRWASGINLSAGVKVYYNGNGCFYTGGDRSIRISAEEIEQIGVTRVT